MSDLDEKLREIIGNHERAVQERAKNTSFTVMEIEQAFKDAGYIKVPQQVEDTWREYNRIAGYMTGQEWYDRFEKELWQPPKQERITQGDDGESHDRFYRVGGEVFMYNQAVAAARKAAGLDTGTQG
jgi:hypothetical protein